MQTTLPRASRIGSVCSLGLFLTACLPAEPDLGGAPSGQPARVGPLGVRHQSTSGLAVDSSNREAVIDFYQRVYLTSVGAESGWTGNLTTCEAGDVSAAYRAAVLLRVHYYRAMAGLPADLQLVEEWSQACQSAALLMSANQQLSHSPLPSWQCYSAAGAEAASKSNLALGVEGPLAVDFFMDDPGEQNYAVGHRRWLLYPPLMETGIGAVPTGANRPAAQAIWVVGDARPRPQALEWVAWPPPGYVPIQVMPRVSARWSFSHPDADFTAAVVKVSYFGEPLKVAIERLHAGFGDDTIVWILAQPTAPFAGDQVYCVSIRNVRLSNGTAEFTYQVTVIDAREPPPLAPRLSIRKEDGLFITLAWPESAAGVRLVSAPMDSLGLPPTFIPWRMVTNSTSLSNGQNTVTLEIVDRPTAFRLR